jgi:formate dehydrogenase subunit gamma
METTAQHDEAVGAALAALGQQPGALLPVLHAIQDSIGFIPPPAVPRIAQALALSRAEVHGVISFYHHFRSTPPAAHTVRICVAESCQAMGAYGLRDHAKAALGADFHQATADGTIGLEPVYCLGACACSPAVMVDGSVHGRMTPARFDAMVAAIRGAIRETAETEKP